ncbi:MAG: protease inhibitor I42 family protein [Solirubrobacteraceae bacterium]
MVGEERTLPLSSLAMAGYRWSGSVQGPDPGAVTLELRRGEPSPAARAGASAPESALLRGVRPGLAVVRLEQRRPWERDQPPADVLELQVEVGGQTSATGPR